MGPRALLLWTTAAVVSTVAAVVAVTDDAAELTGAGRVGEPVFPDLRAAPETAAEIVVVHGDGEVRIVRGEEGWSAPARFGYAADEADVRALLTDLADLRYEAPRTALAERFARLEVQEPAPERPSTRVVVRDDGGAELADAIIGKRSQAITGTERGTYLRLPEDERAWLALGTVDVATDAVEWLATDLPSMARDELKLLVVAPAEGQGFTVGRTTPEADLTLVDQLPADRRPDAAQIRGLAGALSGLRFEDVRPAAETEWPDASTQLTGTSFADRTLEVELATLADGERWVRFAREPEWIYRLPTFQLDRLDKRLADLVAEPEAS